MADPAFKIGPLKTRDTPRQKRAQDRVTQILTAAADLLQSFEPHSMSSTMIAERAGIPVSSIYRYFPKVEDVLDELYQQASEEIEAQVLAVFERTDEFPGWVDRHRAVFQVMRAYRLTHPHYLPLLRSSISRTGPEIINVNTLSGLPAFLATRWGSGLDGFQGGDPEIVANVTMQSFLAIEGFSATLGSPEKADQYFDELSLSVESYLANYLSDDR